MARYTGPKVRLSRRVGVPIADTPKHTGGDLTLPGMHGYRGRRNTEYGVRLTEKQKLKYHYGVLEKAVPTFPRHRQGQQRQHRQFAAATPGVAAR